MAFAGLQITEIFHSLQGETSLSGLRFAFIRLTGCNLRCTYCDSAYAFKGGTEMSIEDVIERIRPWQVKHVLVTGGEPLLQRNTPELVRRLRAHNYLVSIETHGELSIENVCRDSRIILDVKTPSSGMSRGGYAKNLKHLKSGDEIKFVIASEADYAWARELVGSQQLPNVELLFSPAVQAPGQPGNFPGVTATWLAERILEDRLNVRLQTQLHKQLWDVERRGV